MSQEKTIYNEIENPELNKSVELSEGNSDSGGDVMDNRKLNDMIKMAMLSKNKDKS